MPALGESVTEGTVTTWLKSVGDAVDADEPLLEVSTDKVDSEVPSPVAGFLAEIRVPEDETVEVGTVVAIISSSAPSAAPVAEAATPGRSGCTRGTCCPRCTGRSGCPGCSRSAGGSG